MIKNCRKCNVEFALMEHQIKRRDYVCKKCQAARTAEYKKRLKKMGVSHIAAKSQRVLIDIPCVVCEKVFRPTSSTQKNCSEACAHQSTGRKLQRVPRIDMETRFWAKVEKTDGCWYWRGMRDGNGYGRFKLNGKPVYAHRVAYDLMNDVPLGDLLGCHTCDTPNCVRPHPDHVYAGTYADNAQDCVRRGRRNRPQRKGILQ